MISPERWKQQSIVEQEQLGGCDWAQYYFYDSEFVSILCHIIQLEVQVQVVLDVFKVPSQLT